MLLLLLIYKIYNFVTGRNIEGHFGNNFQCLPPSKYFVLYILSKILFFSPVKCWLMVLPLYTCLCVQMTILQKAFEPSDAVFKRAMNIMLYEVIPRL